MSDSTPWRRCSACKQPIALGAAYFACNVSTCNQRRTALAFCSVSCWEVHLPGANHRESWAVEKRAPRTPEGEPVKSTATPAPAPAGGGVRRLVRPASSAPAPAPAPREVLIIASRLKDYVRARSGYNTSDRALEPLSDLVRRAVDTAIENARRDGRMTVLDRDVEV